ncbi:MAG: metal-dependent transcriptional regulator [Candidatus Nanopelagicales bacterium]
MSELIDTTEMYLRTVFELEEEGTPPMRARIAERLRQSGPTVSQTVARMERDGLLSVDDNRIIQLSPIGRSMAARVMRKHRLAECMLVDVLKLEWDQVHAEACRWEHVMSDEVERRLLDLLGYPTLSPFGNPIPALEELDAAPDAPVTRQEGVTLLAAAADDVGYAVVLRIGETVQADEAGIAAFRRAGVRMGAAVKCRRRADGSVQVGSGGEYTEIAADVAAHVWVRPTREDPEARDEGSQDPEGGI